MLSLSLRTTVFPAVITRDIPHQNQNSLVAKPNWQITHVIPSIKVSLEEANTGSKLIVISVSRSSAPAQLLTADFMVAYACCERRSYGVPTVQRSNHCRGVDPRIFCQLLGYSLESFLKWAFRLCVGGAGDLSAGNGGCAIITFSVVNAPIACTFDAVMS
jgi:hypothetical protein